MVLLKALEQDLNLWTQSVTECLPLDFRSETADPSLDLPLQKLSFVSVAKIICGL